MYLSIFSFLLIASAVSASGSHELPPNFETCSRNHANMNDCMKKVVQDALKHMVGGIEDLNIPTIDPLRIPKSTLVQNTGPVAVNFECEDIDFHGISQMTVDSVSVDLKGNEKKIIINVHTPNTMVVKSKCNMSGKILILPISGSGNTQVDMLGATATIVLTGKIVKNAGIEYLVFNSMQLSIDPKGIKYDFSQIFKGDKALGDNMNTLLNENGLLVYSELKPSVEKNLASFIIGVVNNMFTKVPYSKMFPL